MNERVDVHQLEGAAEPVNGVGRLDVARGRICGHTQDGSNTLPGSAQGILYGLTNIPNEDSGRAITYLGERSLHQKPFPLQEGRRAHAPGPGKRSGHFMPLESGSGVTEPSAFSRSMRSSAERMASSASRTRRTPSS